MAGLPPPNLLHIQFSAALIHFFHKYLRECVRERGTRKNRAIALPFQGRTQTDRGEVTTTTRAGVEKRVMNWLGPTSPDLLLRLSHRHGNHRHLGCILGFMLSCHMQPSFSSVPRPLFSCRPVCCRKKKRAQPCCAFHLFTIIYTYYPALSSSL